VKKTARERNDASAEIGTGDNITISIRLAVGNEYVSADEWKTVVVL